MKPSREPRYTARFRCRGGNAKLLRRLLIEAAPVFSGIKPAMLVRISGCVCADDIRHDHLFCRHQNEIVATLGLAHRILVQSASGVLVFFYDPAHLTATLTDSANRLFLIGRGCGDYVSLQEDLNWLENRFHTYSQAFPHEVGLFLGYPLKDVQGFIQKQRAADVGRTLWHVFGDPSKSLALMRRIRNARDRLARALEHETDVERFCLRLARRRRLAS